MKEMYFTITGCNHYFGTDFMKAGMKVKLEKEPDNEYDAEAIQVKIKGMGKCGYVANSPYSIKGESMSAGRLYDKLGDKAKGKILYVVPGGAICMITKTGYGMTDIDSKHVKKSMEEIVRPEADEDDKDVQNIILAE